MEFAGFAIRGYRSFGAEELQLVGPLTQVTAIAGENNVGKSNALAALHRVSAHVRQSGHFMFANVFESPDDSPRGWDESMSVRFAIGVRLSDEDFAAMGVPQNSPFFDAFRAAFASPTFNLSNDDVTWFAYDVEQATNSAVPAFDQIANTQAAGFLSSLSMALSGQSSSDNRANWAQVASRWNIAAAIPEVQYLGAMRQLLADQSVVPGTTNVGKPQYNALINQLADYQSPSNPLARTAMKAKFAELQEFLRRVLDDNQASFDVSGTRDTVFVTTSNGEMQLSRLGAGVEEVILLAVAATLSEGVIVCIEEPELHLHPTLQRQLMNYLRAQTQNRFIVSTHSPHVLNSPDVSVIRAELADGFTKLAQAITETERSHLSFIIGARPSDVVQANFVIWVEGPSDRTYIRSWVREVAPDLTEGVHFAVVFYGGRLLSQISFDDEEVDDLIKLQKVSRRYAIVIDSDRSAPTDEINQTKKRVINEAIGDGAMVWVTAGREIENYLPTPVLVAAMTAAYPDKSYKVTSGEWTNRLSSSFSGMKTKPSKITIAKEVAREPWGAEWPLDLKDRVVELVAAIRQAN